MNNTNYQKRFEHLEELHKQMKAVLEWRKFKIEERNRNPSFRLPFTDNSIGQLADLKSKFFSDSVRLRNNLEEKHKKLPDEQKYQLRNKLTRIEQQVHYLGSNIRVL